MMIGILCVAMCGHCEYINILGIHFSSFSTIITHPLRGHFLLVPLVHIHETCISRMYMYILVNAILLSQLQVINKHIPLTNKCYMRKIVLQAGQIMAVSGPDTTTTCGNPSALLKIDEQYVVGVGSICEAISPWSTLQSYSTNELQTLREFGQDFETRSLKCRAPNIVSSFVLFQTVAIVALVAMTTLFY